MSIKNWYHKGQGQWGTLLRPLGSFQWKMASAFKGDRSLNAPSSKGASRRKLSNYQPFPFSPAAAGGTRGPLVLHWNHDLLGMHGISNNRVWNQTCAFAWNTLLLCPFLHHSAQFFFFFCLSQHLFSSSSEVILHISIFWFLLILFILKNTPLFCCFFTCTEASLFSCSACTREGFNSWSTIVVMCLFT